MAIVLSAGPLVAIPRVVSEPDAREALGFFVLMLVICALNASLFIPALRRVIFTKEGIQVRGFRAFRMRWEEVTAMPAQCGGAMSNIHFERADGGKVVVDATMHGWYELLRFLAQLPPGKARTMAASALAELNRWK
jgi:hypothetical protein